jgi:nucleoside-diphosphate-sugar epimerase
MKIAITGHSAGIGKALEKIYTEQGHEVIGLSRRNGYNICVRPKIADMIEPCDMFINNAQQAWAQTELLFEIWRRWQGQEKIIVNISTQMTEEKSAPGPELDLYLVQKKTLEIAQEVLSERNSLPRQLLVKPGSTGAIATRPGQEPPLYKDVNEYAKETYEWIQKNI